MDQNLRQNIERYKNIDWESLTRKDSFTEGKNFTSQKKLFDQVKKSFDLIFENIDSLSESLPSNEVNQINNNLNQLFQLQNRINGYSDTNRYQEMADDIKRTCFEIKSNLSKYLDYVNPSDVKEKIKKELDELVKVKNEVEKAVKERLNILDQGIEKVSEGKREISGTEVAKFYEDQAARHRNNAEGNGKKLFGKISAPRGWLGSRGVLFWIIIIIIFCAIFAYIKTFILMDSGNWEKLWNVHLGILFVALLSALYAGLYFSTKNYDREKDLEYKNKARANIANTWLTFSAGQSEAVRDIVTKEAAKTLFSDIETVSEKGKGGENRNISISIPQNIGKTLNNNE
jgi:hypothetical protein